MNAVGKGPKTEGPGQGVLATDKSLGRGGWAGMITSASSFSEVMVEGWTHGSQPFLSYLP